MPFFGRKFSPKKPTIRKISEDRSIETLKELINDDGSVTLNLNDYELVFESGEWVPKVNQSGSNVKVNQNLLKRNNELQEEVYLLKIKYEITINMLTKITAEKQLMEKELAKLRKIKKR